MLQSLEKYRKEDKDGLIRDCLKNILEACKYDSYKKLVLINKFVGRSNNTNDMKER